MIRQRQEILEKKIIRLVGDRDRALSNPRISAAIDFAPHPGQQAIGSKIFHTTYCLSLYQILIIAGVGIVRVRRPAPDVKDRSEISGKTDRRLTTIAGRAKIDEICSEQLHTVIHPILNKV